MSAGLVDAFQDSHLEWPRDKSLQVSRTLSMIGQLEWVELV